MTPQQRTQRFERCIPIVREQAGQLIARYGSVIPRADMEGEGALGLAKALQTFDEDRGTNFEPYARVLIRGEILDAMKRSGRIRRVEAAIEMATIRFCAEHPFDADMWAADDATLRSAAQEGCGEAVTAALLAGVLAWDRAVDEDLLYAEAVEAVRKAFAVLTEKQRAVLELVYYRGLTHQQTAEDIGVRVKAVATFHRDAIKRLRSLLEAHGVKGAPHPSAQGREDTRPLWSETESPGSSPRGPPANDR
jgi:RNA polymerase sigma factor (sigma-70 family)